MAKLFYLLTAATVIVFIAACNNADTDNKTADTANAKDSTSFDLSTAKATIEAENAKFIAAFKKGDSTGVADLYSSDALVMPPNMASVQGSNIAAFWGSFMKMGVQDFKLLTDEVAGNETQLAETGRYELYGGENKLLDKGKYIVVWKPANGSWKLYRDIFNSDMPGAPAK